LRVVKNHGLAVLVKIHSKSGDNYFPFTKKGESSCTPKAQLKTRKSLGTRAMLVGQKRPLENKIKGLSVCSVSLFLASRICFPAGNIET